MNFAKEAQKNGRRVTENVVSTCECLSSRLWEVVRGCGKILERLALGFVVLLFTNRNYCCCCCCCLSVPSLGRFDSEEREKYKSQWMHLQSRREYRATVVKENAAVYALSFSMVALGAKFGVDAYIKREEEKEAARDAASEQQEAGAEDAGAKSAGAGKGANAEQGENVFAGWISRFLGKKFYEGGFEEEMTRREAALILGIRESAPKKKVREAHRRLAMLNHPDTGGSTYVASKVNEAKEMLLGAR